MIDYFAYLCDTADDVIKYVKDTSKVFGYAAFFYTIACVLFYFFNTRYSCSKVNNFLKTVKRVLIVTAHPDDECMFFGPFILNILQKKGCKVFLLCLSNGDHYNIGSNRKQELWDSCEVLGIPASHIFLCKNPYMKDDPNIIWRKEEVSKTILEHTESLDIDTIITFDEDGISGHYNHISIFNAVCFLILKKRLPLYSKVYVLESVNLFRKYTYCLDTLLTYLTSNILYQIKGNDHRVIVEAMKKHKSQYVWFRKLYMKFSRYAYINSFRTLDISNAFIEVEDLINGNY